MTRWMGDYWPIVALTVLALAAVAGVPFVLMTLGR